MRIGSYCQYASAEYLSIELSFEQAKSYFTTMITQIKSIDGYSDNCKVAFAGNEFQDKTLYHNDIMDRLSMSGRDDTLVEAYSREYFLRYYCGFSPEYIGIDELSEESIKDMPIYPQSGSIQKFGNIVVIKLSEE